MKQILLYPIPKLKGWSTQIPMQNIPPSHRKAILLFLNFLREYPDYTEAMKYYKSMWINSLYPLPSPQDKKYKSVVQVRSNTLVKMKKITNKYLFWDDENA